MTNEIRRRAAELDAALVATLGAKLCAGRARLDELEFHQDALLSLVHRVEQLERDPLVVDRKTNQLECGHDWLLHRSPLSPKPAGIALMNALRK